ncbi:2-amino-4-hydroxy-6-hydroxymethyldihydropteridine diphosphokinase [Methylococcus sp. EFPC2]|uniref:2-amino-4-hydroxy-6- hydroxymethyldihydropteridine diphosphokinase n=1 Tax=Methylococcus sp. EFPC2 TaxID=2812648 RepID=UPI003530014C
MSSEGVIAYLGLGSNLDDPLRQLRNARAAVAALPQTREFACSRYYRSAPMGPADQPDYVNAVLAVQTTLEPEALLCALQAIEAAQGRVRKAGERWGARTLDLDILLYGDRVICTDRLTVPHVGIAQREFVLYPLAEIAPADLDIPGYGRLADLLDGCPLRGLAVIADD